MAINRDKPSRWKADIARSVDMYNAWFMDFAPLAFRTTRVATTADVESALRSTNNLADIRPSTLRQHPEVLATLRMCACPPLAVDRLVGLAGVSSTLVKSMETEKSLPPRMASAVIDRDLSRMTDVLAKMADPDIFTWLGHSTPPSEADVHRAATIVADRLCGAVANPIIRNAQEKRQLAAIKTWLEARGYVQALGAGEARFDTMRPGTFAFRVNVPIILEDGVRQVKIPVDVAIMPKMRRKWRLPVFFEAKSAGDFTNTNKRRKEEAVKISQIRNTYGKRASLNLFLCGYFDSGYLGYEAAENIDWVWEHRIDDMALFGL